MSGMVKRWQGGTAASKGFSAVGAKIELAKKQNKEPQFTWKIAQHPHYEGRYELQAYSAACSCDETGCVFPLCKSAEEQQEVATQVYEELYSGAK